MSTLPPTNSSESSVPAGRLLDAMSSVLTSELAQLLEEERKKWQAEGKVLLRKAVLDKESELNAMSQADQNRVREETSEKVRAEVTRDLESQFEATLSRELRSVEDRLDDSSRAAEKVWGQERSELGAETERWRVLAEFYQRSGISTSQVEILKRFLRTSGHFAGGVALYLNRPDGLELWGTEGDVSVFPDLVSEETKDPEWYWVPVTVRSRMLFAVAGTAIRNKEGLDGLVGALRRAIETLGLRLGAGVPEQDTESANGKSNATKVPDPRKH